MTNLGVTRRVWEEWTSHPADEADMRGLTPGMVEPLYRERYWRKVRGDELPAGVDLAVFDYAVNSGPGRAAKTLQEVVGVAADGAIGPKTLAAARAMEAVEVINGICNARLEFLRGLPTWPTFGKGWWARVEGVRRQASDLARPHSQV
jgi:lysozyme family protein